MREMTATLGGQELVLAATFKASVEIANTVGDPLTIMREAALESMFLDQGIPYEPKWRFTVTNVVQLIMIGLKAAGSTMKLDEVQDLVFSAGFLAGKEVASNYLAQIAGPQPKEVSDKGEASGN